MYEQWDMARIFVLSRLTAAETIAVELLARDGLNQNEIAERLCLSPRTVEQHLRSAYRKAGDYWGLEHVHQTQLVRLLNLYFTSNPVESRSKSGSVNQGKPARQNRS